MLLIAGDQVPVMPLFDVVGKAGIVAPEQYGPTGLKVGVTFGATEATTGTLALSHGEILQDA